MREGENPCAASPMPAAATFKELMAIAYAAGTEAERIYQLQCGQTPDMRQLFAGAHGDIQVFTGLVGSGLWNAYRAKACAVLQRPQI